MIDKGLSDQSEKMLAAQRYQLRNGSTIEQRPHKRTPTAGLAETTVPIMKSLLKI
jgi:hypothetical protein